MQVEMPMGKLFHDERLILNSLDYVSNERKGGYYITGKYPPIDKMAQPDLINPNIELVSSIIETEWGPAPCDIRGGNFVFIPLISVPSPCGKHCYREGY